jgi:RNA polymerase sigma factor (sigma-70 family)
VNTLAQNDRALIERVAVRDETAFRELHSVYELRIARFVSKTTLNADVIQEITSDTLWAVWKCASAFRGASKVSTWIFGIAHHLTLRRIQYDQRQRSLDVLQWPMFEAVHDPWPGNDASQWLTLAMAQLPSMQRTVMKLAYLRGHSCEEIAQSLECPVNTVKTRLFHARQKLKRLFAEP